MKTRPQFWPLFTILLLFLVLLLTACDSGSDTPQTPTNTVPPTEEVISNNPDDSSDAEPTIVLANSTVAPQNTETPEEYPTAETAPQPTETVASAEVVQSTELVDPTATSEATEATEAPELTATPEVRALVTPRSRTQWRAGSGELFIRFDNGIKNFQYYLYVPEPWYGIFEMRQDTEDIFLFNYIGNPEMKQEVFRVQAFPEHIWAEKKAAGDLGVEFHTLRNVTFVYYTASENPFEGEEAEVFQQMIDDVPEIINDELEIVSRRFNKE